MGALMSKNAASVRRAKAAKRRQFAPYHGYTVQMLVNNVSPIRTPFYDMLTQVVR